jgi:diguanylate cyclase (GGDEF)-like protein/PAS domain S-box-containing protein
MLRALANLSSDWYWEQDAKLRFTGVEALNPKAGALPLATSILGKKRWETGVEIEGGWQAHRAVLAAREPFRDVLMWRTIEGGSRRFISVSGEPVFDRSGRFAGYRGIGRDVSAQQRAERALRLSEARFRSLANLSSDWFWEQDAQYRFTRIEGRQVAGGDRSLRERLIGARRWETGLEVEGGWEAHRAVLEARKPFYNVLMWRTMPDGKVRYVSVSGEPVFAEEGSFAGNLGVGSDVTAQKRDEQLLRLEHQVARALSEADDAAGGMKAVLQAVCETEDWGCGRYFRLDEAAGVLRFEDGWCLPEPMYERFLEASRPLVFRSGQGLCGIVWQSGEPVWSPDTSRDARVLGKALAQDSSIRGAFAFGAVAEGRTIGVLGFSSHAVREPDQRLLQAIRVVGAQIGQFVQRAHAEQALRESEERFRSLTQLSSDFFWESDERHKLSQLVHGPGYQRAIGHSEIGKATWEIPSVNPDEAGWAAHRETFERRLPFRDFEFARAMPDGVIRHFSVSGEPRFGADGRFFGYRGVGRDVTEIALAREHIASLAYHDPLTGLANRTSLGPALELTVQRARRKHAKVAVVFIDLDGFKQVNDIYGHDAGDALLIEVANRLRANLRASDLMARLGGDEFVVVLEEVQDLAPVETVARKLNADLARSYAVAGNEAVLTASIGVSVYPDDASDAASLMKHADVAMYAAKQAGKNAFSFYASGPAANDPARAAERAPGRGG